MIDNILFFNSIEGINKSKWDEFIDNNRFKNIFQTFELYDFWKKQNKCEAFIYFFESCKGECLAFCTGVTICEGKSLVKLFSRRSIIFGGPLINRTLIDKNIVSYIIKKIITELDNSSIYTEFRNFYDETNLKEIFEVNRCKYIPYQNYIIKLTNEEEVFNKFNKERRRQIRKALREGVEYSYEKSLNNVLGVYKVLFEVYIERVKKPLPKLEFFENLMLLELSGLISVTYNNKIIGGGFFLFDKDTIYDWYRGGLDSKYIHKYPSAVADWGIMRYGLNNEILRFDFMGAGVKDVEYGVRSYKSKFGGELVEFGRFSRINKPFLYFIASIGLSFSKKVIKLKKISFNNISIKYFHD